MTVSDKFQNQCDVSHQDVESVCIFEQMLMEVNKMLSAFTNLQNPNKFIHYLSPLVA